MHFRTLQLQLRIRSSSSIYSEGTTYLAQEATRSSCTNCLRWPNTSLLPTELLSKATHNVLKNKDIAFPALEYGPEQGDPRLRKNVASWLSKFYGTADPISEDRVCITGGASQNLACLLQVFTDPAYTRNVWIVAPAYMLSFNIFKDSGFNDKLRAVPEDPEGLDIEYLRWEIRKSEHKAKIAGNNKPVSHAKCDDRLASLKTFFSVSKLRSCHTSREYVADICSSISNLHDHGVRSTSTSSMLFLYSPILVPRP